MRMKHRVKSQEANGKIRERRSLGRWNMMDSMQKTAKKIKKMEIGIRIRMIKMRNLRVKIRSKKKENKSRERKPKKALS